MLRHTSFAQDRGERATQVEPTTSLRVNAPIRGVTDGWRIDNFMTTNLARERLLAWLIDILLVLGVSALVGSLGGAVSLGYVLLRDGFFEGQSVGKRIMGLRVAAHGGELRCTFLDSIVRNVLWVIPLVNIAMGLTGLHALMHDPEGRHWGDRLANTRVVRVSS